MPLPSPILKRRDFLAAARGFSWTTPGFVLQARRRPDGHPEPAESVRLGLTASKKVGNAVARNRARRRLRALGWRALGALGRPGWDYVLIARAETTAARGFAQMEAEMRAAIDAVHDGRRPARGPRSGRGRSKSPDAAPRLEATS